MIELSNFKKSFLGECLGVGLQKRGPQDDHVTVFILVEDDGSWFISGNGFSSFWLPELIPLLQEANTWMKRNCVPDMYKGVQSGWKFKK